MIHHRTDTLKYLFTTVFIFFSIFGLMAQSDFRNGYIIKNNYDTIYGLIDYKGNKANALKCIFREDGNTENQIFTPEEINGYRFSDSKLFVSKLVRTGSEEKQVFLEYLINGIVDVYYYRDNYGEHYLVDYDGNMYELKNEEKEVLFNNTHYLIESKEYIGVLRTAFKESPSISERIDDIELNQRSLVDITQDYHNEVCTDEKCIIYEKRLIKTKKTLGIVAGVNMMSVSQIHEITETADLYYLRNSHFGLNFSPALGLFYKAYMPYLNERLYFQYEVTYSSFNLVTSNLYNKQVPYNMDYIHDISLTLNTINNLVLIKYEYPNGKIKPTFQIGTIFRYFFNPGYMHNLEVKYPWGSSYFMTFTNDNPFKKSDFGLNCGIGIRCNYLDDKELFLDLRYQRGIFLLRGFHTNTFLINLGFQLVGR